MCSQEGLQIDTDKFASGHHKGRNEIGKNIVEDLLSRMELEHLILNKTMSPIESWGTDHRASDRLMIHMAEGNSEFPSQDPSGIFSRLYHHHLMDQHRRMSVDCERPGIQVFKFIGLMNRPRMRRAHCSSMLVLSEEVRS